MYTAQLKTNNTYSRKRDYQKATKDFESSLNDWYEEVSLCKSEGNLDN